MVKIFMGFPNLIHRFERFYKDMLLHYYDYVQMIRHKKNKICHLYQNAPKCAVIQISFKTFEMRTILNYFTPSSSLDCLTDFRDVS